MKKGMSIVLLLALLLQTAAPSAAAVGDAQELAECPVAITEDNASVTKAEMDAAKAEIEVPEVEMATMAAAMDAPEAKLLTAADVVKLDVANGYIVISEAGYQQQANVSDLKLDGFIPHTGSYELTGTNEKTGITANDSPAVQIIGGTEDDPIEVTLNGATITRDPDAPALNDRDVCAIMVGHRLRFAGIFSTIYTGHAAITLAEGTVNTLRSSGSHAGLQITSDGKQPSSVVIRGTGTLNAQGGHVGTDVSGGAGIGTEYLYSSVNNNRLTIEGGIINAVGGKYAAGIGGSGSDAGLESIKITGGTITAVGGLQAPGIGSGNQSRLGKCDIRIEGGNVTATGGKSGPGIGAGILSEINHTITITGGEIHANGGANGGNGIGSSGGAHNTIPTGTCLISLEGGDITATGGPFGTGIGMGFSSPADCTVNISGGTILAAGGSQGPGIGLGNASTGDCDVNITGGGVTAVGGIASAGIGGGYDKGAPENSKLVVRISGADTVVNATGRSATSGGLIYGGAGIGGGAVAATKTQSYTVESITLTGGTITATGGAAAAGIGCGTDAVCGAIEIGANTAVTAIGGIGATGIGRGRHDPAKLATPPALTISKDAAVRAYAVGGYDSTTKNYPEGEYFQAIDEGITTVKPAGQAEETHLLVGLFEQPFEALGATTQTEIKLAGTNGQHLLTLPAGYQSFASTVAAGEWMVGANSIYYSGGAAKADPDAAQTHLFDTAIAPITNTWYLKAAVPSIADHKVTFALGTNGVQTAGDKTALVQTIITGGTAAVPQVTANSGYTFTGWTPDPKKPITADTTFVAQYSQNSSGGDDDIYYTVTFRAGENGTISGAQSYQVRAGGKLTAVPNVVPNKGFEFLGWSMDGKTTVDPRAASVNKNAAYTALYRAQNPGDLLDRGDHTVPFIQGDNHGNFRPEEDITRAEVAAIFSRIMPQSEPAPAAAYHDVARDAWYAPAVDRLTALGIFSGYPDGTFHPEQPISRSELTAVIARFADPKKTETASFTDVDGTFWAAQYIQTAAAYGWVQGYPDGTFRPAQPIVRAETVAMVNRLLERHADTAYIDANVQKLTTFTDLPANHWAYYDVMEAANGHKYTREGDAEHWTA